MSQWLAGKVIESRHWTDTLFSLRVEAPALRFTAGQFVRIALDLPSGRVARPFSFVNPPEEAAMEFYGVIVPQGPLSPRLSGLKAGDTLYVADNPSGFLVLAEVPPAEDLWLLATGTGIAPFLSILRTETPWQKYRRVILVHAARFAKELVYGDLIQEISGSHPGKFVSLKFISREKSPNALEGRMPAAIRDGRLEKAGGAIAPERSQFMLCGNPEMLKDVTAALAEKGLKKHRRRSPGQITVESFW